MREILTIALHSAKTGHAIPHPNRQLLSWKRNKQTNTTHVVHTIARHTIAIMNNPDRNKRDPDEGDDGFQTLTFIGPQPQQVIILDNVSEEIQLEL